MGATFLVNMIKRIAGKLRRIILLHFGLVTFRFHYGEPPEKIVLAMISGFLDVFMTPQTKYVNFGDPNSLQKDQETSRNVF